MTTTINIEEKVYAGPTGATAASHFVYQRIHVFGGKALHLDDHLRFAARAFEHIYGYPPALDPRDISARVAGSMRTHRPEARTGSTVLLQIIPRENDGHRIAISYERPLLDAGYAHSALRPRAVSFDYGLPFGGFPTGFHLAARELFDTLALRQYGAGRSVRRRGDVLLTCGDAPLFAIRGRVLFTTPLTEGAMDGVEREMVIDAAPRMRLTVREEPILHTGLKSYDELFLADAAGITSLAECDGARFMSLIAPRLAGVME
jgi:hypothetical protein